MSVCSSDKSVWFKSQSWILEDFWSLIRKQNKSELLRRSGASVTSLFFNDEPGYLSPLLISSLMLLFVPLLRQAFYQTSVFSALWHRWHYIGSTDPLFFLNVYSYCLLAICSRHIALYIFCSWREQQTNGQKRMAAKHWVGSNCYRRV